MEKEGGSGATGGTSGAEARGGLRFGKATAAGGREDLRGRWELLDLEWRASVVRRIDAVQGDQAELVVPPIADPPARPLVAPLVVHPSL